MKTLTVGELIEELKKIPPHVPIFTYDPDKQKDGCVEVVELSGPVLEPRDNGYLHQEVPHYCCGMSNVEMYWKQHGYCPVVYIREYYRY